MRLIKKTLLFSLLLTCAYTLNAQTSRDFQEIRQRAISLLLEGGFQEGVVSLWLNSREEKGSWPDIDCVDTSRTGFDHARHLDRVNNTLSCRPHGTRSLSKEASSCPPAFLRARA